MSYEGIQEELPMRLDVGAIVSRANNAADEVAEPDTSKHLGLALGQTEQMPLTFDERNLVAEEIIKEHKVSARALRRRQLLSGTRAEEVVQTALERLAEKKIPTVTEPPELLQQYKTKRRIANSKRLSALARAALRHGRPTPLPPPSPTNPRYGR